MAETPSTMLELGTQAPDFSLTNAVDGKTVRLTDFQGKPALLVMFICNHCPYVQHVLPELTRLEKDYLPKGVAIVGINSNDVKSYPDDSPANMKKLAKLEDWKFPFLFDETQQVAKDYRAACTPDFYLFDKNRKLVYRGQLDDSRPGNRKPLTGKDLRAAIDTVLAGKPVPEDQIPSVGCNIKWRRGNAPDYY